MGRGGKAQKTAHLCVTPRNLEDECMTQQKGRKEVPMKDAWSWQVIGWEGHIIPSTSAMAGQGDYGENL